MVTVQRRSTLEDLAKTPNDGRRYELIDGEIVVAAAPTWMHQRTSRAIFLLLDGWVESHRLGAVQYAPFDAVLAPGTTVRPDVAFIATATLAHLADDGRLHAAPDLVVEVVSPTERGRDSVTKLYQYASAGVAEYWLVDPIARSFLVLGLEGSVYAPQEPDADGRLTSAVLPGLTVDPAALFEAALGPAS